MAWIRLQIYVGIHISIRVLDILRVVNFLKKVLWIQSVNLLHWVQFNIRIQFFKTLSNMYLFLDLLLWKYAVHNSDFNFNYVNGLLFTNIKIGIILHIRPKFCHYYDDSISLSIFKISSKLKCFQNTYYYIHIYTFT